MKVTYLASGEQANITADAYNKLKSSAYQRGAFCVELDKTAFVYSFELDYYNKGLEDALKMKGHK